MAVFLYKGFYIFKAIASLISSHMLLPSHNTNTYFFLVSFSMYSCAVFVMISTPLSGFTNPWTSTDLSWLCCTSEIQPLAWLSLIIYSYMFLLFWCGLLHFTSTFLALTDLLASNLHLIWISMFRKAKCMFPPHKIHLHSYRCKMVHLLSPLYFISVSNHGFRILQ
jgi:hypothetical protein